MVVLLELVLYSYLLQVQHLHRWLWSIQHGFFSEPKSVSVLFWYSCVLLRISSGFPISVGQASFRRSSKTLMWTLGPLRTSLFVLPSTLPSLAEPSKTEATFFDYFHALAWLTPPAPFTTWTSGGKEATLYRSTQPWSMTLSPTGWPYPVRTVCISSGQVGVQSDFLSHSVMWLCLLWSVQAPTDTTMATQVVTVRQVMLEKEEVVRSSTVLNFFLSDQVI